MPCFGRKCLHSDLNTTNHTLSRAKNGKMTIFHGKSLNSMMIPFRNVIDESVRFRGYKSTNWGYRWWGVNHWGGWGVNHSEGAKYVKWAKKPNIKKSDKNSKKIKRNQEKIFNFLLLIIVTTLHPPYHAQNVEVSWGGPWESTDMHKTTGSVLALHGIP